MSDYQFLPLRPVPLPDPTQQAYGTWLDEIDRALDDPECDRAALCARVLEPLVHGETSELVRLQLDPRNVTLEPEYYAETDLARYARVKPLLWLWEMFDRTLLAENVELGIRFRRLLARRVFRSCGKNFKAFHHVKFSFGYNLDVGDGVVVHRHVLLDDRGGIRLGNNVSISDFVNVYSHTHDIVDGRYVTCPPTVIGDGVRVTYHATVLAGVTLEPNSMVGTGAIVTRSVPADFVAVGIPAKPVKRKPARDKGAPTRDPLAEG